MMPATQTAHIPNGKYLINVEFVVDTHGYIGQVKAINDPGYGLTERAVKHIREYKGAWRTATQCGRPVKTYQRQSVRIQIS